MTWLAAGPYSLGHLAGLGAFIPVLRYQRPRGTLPATFENLRGFPQFVKSRPPPPQPFLPCLAFLKAALKTCFLSHALGSPKWQSPATPLQRHKQRDVKGTT